MKQKFKDICHIEGIQVSDNKFEIGAWLPDQVRGDNEFTHLAFIENELGMITESWFIYGTCLDSMGEDDFDFDDDVRKIL